MEAAREEDAAGPSDLVNYDDRAQQGEEQQLLEPPYDGAEAGVSGTTMHLDQEARNLSWIAGQRTRRSGSATARRRDEPWTSTTTSACEA